MNVLLVALVVVVIAIIIHFYVNIRNVNRKLDQWTRRPRGKYLLGQLTDLDSITKIISSSRKFQLESGKLLRISIGIFNYVQITDLKFLEFMFTSPKFINKSVDYRYFERWLSKGLFTSSGQQWHQMRKLITPAFHFQILEEFIDVFNNSSYKLIDKIERMLDKSIDIDLHMRLFTLDIICETSLGTSPDENSDYVKSIDEITHIVALRGFSLFKQSDLLYFFSRDYWKEKKAIKIVHEYTYAIIKRRREEIASKKHLVVENKEDSFGRKKRQAFLDLLLESKIDGRPLTDEEIRQECDTIMFAGHDTTSTALSFMLYSLAMNPEVQERVVEELRSIFGDDKFRHINHKDIQDMRYLEMVVKETLRLYPPAPFFSRETLKDEEFYGGIIPPDVPLVVFPFGIHRDPEQYPDPDKFDPERFTPENQASRHPFSFIPFSAGARNCIGQKFAMLEMKNAMANLLRKFEVLPVPEHKIELCFQVILKSVNGVHVKFKHRTF